MPIQRLNLQGLEILDIKKELLKTETPIIQKALVSMSNDMLKQGLLTVELHHSVQNSDVSELSFKEELLQNAHLMKTHAELEKEFEVIATGIKPSLISLAEEETFPRVILIPNVEKDTLDLKISFEVGEEFVKDYFGQCTKTMMDRKGFVEKFVVLRFSKIMKDYLSKSSKTQAMNEFVDLHPSVKGVPSGVYFEQNKKIYAIDYSIQIDIGAAEENIDEISLIVNEEAKSYIDFFSHAMGVPLRPVASPIHEIENEQEIVSEEDAGVEVEERA